MADDDQQRDDQSDDPGDDQRQAPERRDEPAEPTTLEEALRALDAERRLVSQTREEAGDHRKKAKQLERELAEERTKGLSEAEKANVEARREERALVDAEWRERYMREAITAAAGSRMRDPDDAYGLLYASGALDDLRELDPDAMRPAAGRLVEKLVEAKPHLAVGDQEQDGASGALSLGVRQRLGRGDTGQGGDESDWLRRATRRKQPH